MPISNSVPYDIIPGDIPNAYAWLPAVIPGLPIPNLFAKPKINVTSAAKDLFTPGELDAVIAHEAGHVAHGHLYAKTIVPTLSTSVTNRVLKAKTGMGILQRGAIRVPAKIGFGNALSYGIERNADTYALKRGHAAGLASALTKLESFTQEQPAALRRLGTLNGWMSGSIHPGIAGRIRRASRWAEKAKKQDLTKSLMMTRLR